MPDGLVCVLEPFEGLVVTPVFCHAHENLQGIKGDVLVAGGAGLPERSQRLTFGLVGVSFRSRHGGRCNCYHHVPPC